MDKNTLIQVGEWANSRVVSGQEPPWTFHKLKLLAQLTAELADGLEQGVAYTPGLSDGSAVGDELEQLDADNVVDISTFKAPEEEPFANLPS